MERRNINSDGEQFH